MKTLKESLQNLVDQFFVECVIEERSKSDGYRLIFKHLIPSFCLNKLVAFCNLYSCIHYISAEDDHVLFNIYRES